MEETLIWASRRWSLSAACIFAGLLLLPSVAAADGGIYITPSVSFGRVYDDNIFASPLQKEAVSILRLSPALETDYESELLTLDAYYTFDAERYVGHPELNGNDVRRHAILISHYRPTSLLTLSLTGDYIDTHTPAELAPTTGLELGRVPARLFSTTPSMAYRFDPITTGTAAYTFTRDEELGGLSTDTHTTELGLSRGLGPLDTLSFNYIQTHYFFDIEGEISSQVFTVGWAHSATPQTSFSLAAGPRRTEGSVTPELAASIRHVVEGGEWSLMYARSQTAVVGQVGIVNTRAITADVIYSPTESLQFRAEPSYVSDTRDAQHADVYRLFLEMRYRFNLSVELVSSYQHSLQRGILGLGGPTDQEINDNIIYLGLTFSWRLSRDAAGGVPPPSPLETFWPTPVH